MQTIIVPLDESTLAEEALPWAAYLARAYDCSVKLLTVWDAGHHVLERVALHHRPVAGAVEADLRARDFAVAKGECTRSGGPAGPSRRCSTGASPAGGATPGCCAMRQRFRTPN